MLLSNQHLACHNNFKYMFTDSISLAIRGRSEMANTSPATSSAWQRSPH